MGRVGRGLAVVLLLGLPVFALLAVGLWSELEGDDDPPADNGGGGGVPVDPAPVPVPLPAPVPGPFPGLPDPGGAPGREPAVTIVIDDGVAPLPAESSPPTTEPPTASSP